MRTNHLDKDVIGQVGPSGLPCRGALEDELIAGWDKKEPRPRPGLKVDERSPPPQARWPDSSEPTPVPKALPTPIWGGRPSCGEWTNVRFASLCGLKSVVSRSPRSAICGLTHCSIAARFHNVCFPVRSNHSVVRYAFGCECSDKTTVASRTEKGPWSNGLTI